MSVIEKASGEISVPSNSNRDLGVFLVFLGLAVSFPVKALLGRVLDDSPWLGLMGPLGFVVVLWGFLLLRFTRKRFCVQSGCLRLRDGWFTRGLRYTWEESPLIRLRSQEEERGRDSVIVWLVNLVDGKRQYVLDRRDGNQAESRSLAEALAKKIDCPLLETCGSGELLLPREELDLPFRERVKLHPELLGEELEKPEDCSIHEQILEEGRVYRWRYLSPATLNDFGVLAFFLGLLAIVPIFSSPIPGSDQLERFQLSFFDLARQQGKFLYFYIAGILVFFNAVLLFGYVEVLKVTRDRVQSQDTLWGIPCSSASIPADKLEEIWVRQSSRGAHLDLVSDDCIISGRISDGEVAAWLASRLRHFYAK